MKRFALGSLIGAFVLFVIGAIAWHTAPKAVATILLKLNNMSAGLTEKIVSTDVGEINYLEGGTGETVVLVHGIFARKEHWVDLARSLVKEYRVIAIDLPGFGANPPLADGQYLLDQQSENLLTVLEALELENVHIAANSMGAYVSVLLAASRPKMVASIAFIGSPLGVPTPIRSDMDLALALGQIPLLAQSEEDFLRRNEWLSPNIPYVPSPVLKSWMASEVANAGTNARIWDIVHNQSNVPTVLELAPSLTMPSLVFWCQPDRIFHFSGASLLDTALPHARIATPENCGHLPMLDQPEKVAQVYLNFLSEFSSANRD